MVVASMQMRRRTVVERKVLGYLRDQTPAALTPAQRSYFTRLRALAKDRGLVVQAAGAPYLNESELMLLGWLAQAQRSRGVKAQDKMLLEAVIDCAEVLKANKVRLSSLSLYAQARI